MAHKTWVPQLHEKSDEKHDYHTISKEFGTTAGSTKSSPSKPKASPTGTSDRLTTQDTINASLRKSTMHHYVSQHAKNICIIRHAGKNIVQRKT